MYGILCEMSEGTMYQLQPHSAIVGNVLMRSLIAHFQPIHDKRRTGGSAEAVRSEGFGADVLLALLHSPLCSDLPPAPAADPQRGPPAWSRERCGEHLLLKPGVITALDAALSMPSHPPFTAGNRPVAVTDNTHQTLSKRVRTGVSSVVERNLLAVCQEALRVALTQSERVKRWIDRHRR